MDATAAIPVTEKVATNPAFDHETEVSAVFDSLENPKYQWRTVEGIAAETGVPVEHITNILTRDLRDVVMRNAVPDSRGRALFTTRTRYKKTSSFRNRILSALSDQIR